MLMFTQVLVVYVHGILKTHTLGVRRWRNPAFCAKV
jgi:hypothetical protein